MKTVIILAAAFGSIIPIVAAAQMSLDVRTYASQVNDVDSVNAHWFETEDGIVLIDTQRLLPEAERALEHLLASTDQDVVSIVVTHAHTDHYGGLPVWTEAFPEAAIYTDETTLTSIREDGRGFIAMRNERHGDRFADHTDLIEAVAEAEIVASGDEIEVGGTTLIFDVLGPSEAESTLTVTIEDANVAFIGDLVNVGAPAVPFEDIDNWLEQLDKLTARYGNEDRLYIGHGPAPIHVAEIAEQRRFLLALRTEVAAALAGDGVLDEAEIEAVVFAIEAEWPFLEGVAGNTRREVLAFAAGQVASQLGTNPSGTN